MRMRCFFGLHDWRIAQETASHGTGYTEDPADFECGGVDYVIACSHCPKTYVDRRRGFWTEPNFPRLAR